MSTATAHHIFSIIKLCSCNKPFRGAGHCITMANGFLSGMSYLLYYYVYCYYE